MTHSRSKGKPRQGIRTAASAGEDSGGVSPPPRQTPDTRPAGAGAAADSLAETERMAELGRAVATVTHEIRNPLAAMRTWLHVLEQKLPPDDPDLSKPIDRIKRGIRQCDNIIDDLLDFSRSSDLNPQPTRIDGWLQALIHEQLFPEGVAVTFHPGLADRRLPIDRERLRRAVVNLIENACQAIEGERKPGIVTVSTLPAAPNVLVRVADTGPGVPDEIRGRIFEPLFSTKGSGIGLGLAIVRDTVEQHGGTIRVEDSPGGGACFDILLPAPDEGPEA